MWRPANFAELTNAPSMPALAARTVTTACVDLFENPKPCPNRVSGFNRF